MSPFVLIVGPTGSGKSNLGLALAEKFNGAILNCDSLQTYQRLDIGSAKPTRTERELVPHFLFDVLSPGEVLTAGDFRRLALEVLQRELPRRIVFGVGGSGFYIQALEKGMFDVPKPKPDIEKRVREEAELLGPAGMYAQLEKLDSEYATTLSPSDSYRVLRALIIIHDSGEKVSVLRERFAAEAQEFPFPLLKLGLAPTREELLPRVEERTRTMLKQGLLAEVHALVDEGYGEWPALKSVGYKECLQCLRGTLPEEKLAAAISEKTMQLAKKQKTWFKRDSNTHWLPIENPLAAAEELLAAFLDSRR